MGEQFDKLLPFYLSIGMTYTEYWEGDNKLPRYFREAYRERQKQRDYELWLQGLYFYDGISVALFNAFAEKKSKPAKYPEEPYTIRQEKEYQKQKEEKQKELEMQKFKTWLVQLQQLTKKE